MPTSPITINTLPSAPTTLDPTNFDLRADALLSALPQMVSQINSVALTTYSNAVQSENAAAAASVSGAPTWISGGTYALYEMKPDDYGLNPEQQISDSPVHIFFTTLK